MTAKLRKAVFPAAGLGTRDVSKIEIAGTPVKQVMFDFAKIRRERRAHA